MFKLEKTKEDLALCCLFITSNAKGAGYIHAHLRVMFDAQPCHGSHYEYSIDLVNLFGVSFLEGCVFSFIYLFSWLAYVFLPP